MITGETKHTIDLEEVRYHKSQVAKSRINLQEKKPTDGQQPGTSACNPPSQKYRRIFIGKDGKFKKIGEGIEKLVPVNPQKNQQGEQNKRKMSTPAKHVRKNSTVEDDPESSDDQQESKDSDNEPLAQIGSQSQEPVQKPTTPQHTAEQVQGTVTFQQEDHQEQPAVNQTMGSEEEMNLFLEKARASAERQARGASHERPGNGTFTSK